MSLSYVESKVREALKISGGNVVRARQQLIAWTYEDSKLLHALTKNHMTGIVAYHVDRVLSGRTAKPKPPPSQPKKPTVAPEPGDEFGQEILKAVANSSSAVFGLEGYSAPQKRGQASQRHIDAIHQMAAKQKSKFSK